jgi:hypothetical protein
MDAPRPDEPKPQESADKAAASSSAPARVRGAAVQYNFLPAAAVVADQYVVATSREMLQDVIDVALAHANRTDAAAIPATDSWLIDAPSFAAILRDNREELIVNRMLEENESKQAAAGTVDLFLELLGYIDSVRLTSQVREKESRATLEIRTAINGKPVKALKER